jgi:predicted house-cleaning noncanonical NTP pyrophosphatase (MazG superfamily)
MIIFSKAFRGSGTELALEIVWLLIGTAMLLTMILIFLKLTNLLGMFAENNSTLEKIISSLEKNRAALGQINQNTLLSESAKAVASRDADRQAIREAVFDRLHQQDFETSCQIIDEIAKLPDYKALAEQLRTEVNNFRNANDAERLNQVIEHIDRLLESYQWTKASCQIERLIKAKPDSERVKQLQQKLFDKKQERKKILLNAWDEAVKRRATDRSIEILRELDAYLTANEALALQEAARDVFRTKLHNLGVQFSLAVSGREWGKALQTSQEIIRDFPNSKMAAEIRERMFILKEKCQQQIN